MAANVLMVSGSQSTRSLFQNHVGTDRCKVHESEGAAQAWAWLEAGNRPEAVVLDLELAEGHALDLARRLRERPDLAMAPILVLYKPEDLAMLEEEQPPVDDYLEKPLTAKDTRHRALLLLRLALANRLLGA
jgi:CheY-like chemotaxis protein